MDVFVTNMKSKIEFIKMQEAVLAIYWLPIGTELTLETET